MNNLLRKKLVDLHLIYTCQDVNFYNSLYRLKHFIKNKNEGQLTKNEFQQIKLWLTAPETKYDA